MSIAKYLAKLAQNVNSQGQLSASSVSGSFTTPTITAIAYPGDDTAADPNGGQTITLTGTNFANGAKVIINGVTASVVTVVNSTQITFTTPAIAAGSYILYVVNTNGSTAIAAPGIQYSAMPVFSTAAGTLGTVYETATINTPVAATSDSTISYALFSGSLPPGVNIDSSTGTISGTSSLTAASTTYTFTIRATDSQLQDAYRQFSLTINPDVVTFTSPANASTITAFQNTNTVVPLSATSALGSSITYTSSNLPAGLTISGSNIAGAPTVLGSTSSTVTATTLTSSRTATTTFNWTILVSSDIYWPYTTLLLNAENDIVPFAADSSTNNFPLTVAGDTKPTKFNPYTLGYYSNFFDGTGDSLTVTGDGSCVNFGTADFTIETWVYVSSLASGFTIMDTCPGGVLSPTNRIYFDITTDGTIRYATYQGATILISSSAGAVLAKQWTHVALVKYNNQTKLYVNGTQVGSTYADTLNYPAQTNRPILSANGYDGASYSSTGYLSNYRIVKGTAVYTANFTPPTQPLTAITGTSLLTCQSNRLIDLSTNAFTMTKTGDVAVTGFQPFTPSATYATYGSAHFDGTGDYLSIPNNSVFNFGTGDFTVEFWIFCTSAWTSMTNPGIAGQKTSDATNGWQIYRNGSNATDKMNVRLAASGDFPSSVAPGINTWEHWALVRNGTTLTWYKDGVAAGSYTGVSANITDAGIFYIGYTQTWGGYFGGGYLSNIRIVKGTAVYTGAFTPPTAPLTAITNTSLLTLQTHQPTNNSQFVDNSTLAGPITRFGNTTQGTFSPYGNNWSTGFAAKTDVAYVPASTALTTFTGDFTLECWVYMTEALAWGIWDSRQTAGSLNGHVFNIGGTPARPYFYNGTVYSATSGSVPLNQWVHIAYVRSGSTMTFYIDGVNCGTATLAGTLTGTATSSAVNLGSKDGSVAGYGNTGYMSNLRLVNGTAVYTSNFTPSKVPLTAIPNTVLLTYQDGRLVDNGPNNLTVSSTTGTSIQKFSPFSTVTQTPQTYSTYFTLASDQRYSVPAGTAFSYGTGDFTVEGWFFMPTMTTPNYGSAIFAQTANGNNYFLVNLEASAGGVATGKIQIVLNHGNTFSNGSNSYIAGTWNHFAACRASGVVTVYLNGQGGTPTANTTNLNDTVYLPTVGGYTNGSANNFNGYLSNLRVVKGTAVYTANFTPPTAPLTAISGTSLLTCQSTTIRDNSANAFAITTGTVSPKPSKLNPIGYTTSSAQDYSPATFGGSAYFDGTSDYLTLPTSPAYLIGTGNFTIECWVYKRSTTFDTILSYSSSNGMRIFVNGSGGLELWIGGSQQWTFAAIVPSNQWNHIAFVRTGTTIRGYVNGVSVASATISTDYNAGTLNIGGEGTGNPWSGYITDLRITKGQALYTNNFVPTQTPLTAGTNTILLINGDRAAIADKSGKSVLETVGDVQISTVQKKYGTGALYFDGTGDYLATPASSNFAFNTGDFTIEAWVYLNAYNTTYGSQIVGCHTYGVGADWFWTINTTGKLYLQITGTAAGAITSTSSVPLNQWTHVAVRRASGVVAHYINGVDAGGSGTYATTMPSVIRFSVGGDQAGNGAISLNGYIDDLRVTKGFARYTANFTPPTGSFSTK